VIVGNIEGERLGSLLGIKDGKVDGVKDGAVVGGDDGDIEGVVLGIIVRDAEVGEVEVGDIVFVTEGPIDGCNSLDGLLEGLNDGFLE